MRSPEGLPRYVVYANHRRYYVRFSSGGRQYKKPVCPIEGTARNEAEAEAGKIVAATIAKLNRTQAERELQNPIAQYEKRIRSRSIGHQENCIKLKRRFNEYFAGRSLLSIAKSEIEEWRDWLLNDVKRHDKGKGERGLSPKYVKEHLDWLATVYKSAGMRNPCQGVERPKRTHAERVDALEFFSPDEMRRLFEVCAQVHPTWINGFTVLAYTGCRVAEVQGMRPEDMDVDNQIVYVTGKGSKRRPLKLSGPLQGAWDALVSEILERPRADGFIFPQYETWARKMIDRLCLLAFGYRIEGKVKIPLRPGHPHMCRHSLAALALLHFNPPWKIEFLARWLGHADINTTYRIYGHWIAVEPPSGYDARTTLERPEILNVNN